MAVGLFRTPVGIRRTRSDRMGSRDAASRQRLRSRAGAAQSPAAAREGAWAVLGTRAAQGGAALSVISSPGPS